MSSSVLWCSWPCLNMLKAMSTDPDGSLYFYRVHHLVVLCAKTFHTAFSCAKMIKSILASKHRKAYFMAIKIFVLGLPGSGKSSACRCIVDYIRQEGRSALHFGDHEILREMFLAETAQQFRPTAHDGFDVLDFSVFDIALKKLEEEVQLLDAAHNEFIVIEFSRADYSQAFEQFNADFLQNSYFLFLDADIDICLNRIRLRVTNPASPDDHFVSEDIFEAYYKNDARQYMAIDFKAFGVEVHRVRVIDNRRSYDELVEKLHMIH